MTVTLAHGAAAAVHDILRIGDTDPANAQVASSLIAKDGDLSHIVTDLLSAARATTSVATTTYQFFTGATPTSAGMDYLVSPAGANPTNLNSAYYENLSVENRYINLSVSLGTGGGAGAAAFAERYGALDLNGAVKLAYATIFGAAPTDVKVAAILDSPATVNGVVGTRADYLTAVAHEATPGLGAKAATVGWLLSEAIKSDLGIYAHANSALLTAATSGHDVFGADMVTTFNDPSFIYTG